MSHISGTDTAYSSISNIHLYLNVTNDYVEKAENSYCNLFSKGATDENTGLYTPEYNDQWNPELFKKIKKYDQTCIDSLAKNTKATPKGALLSTPFTMLKQLPFLSSCLELVNIVNYQNILNSYPNITFFAFENSNENSTIVNNFLSSYKNNPYYIKEFLKFHTLKFDLHPSQLVNKKMRLTTLCKSNYIYADGTNNVLTIYVKHDELNNFSYPNQYELIKVKSWIKLDYGWLYIIEKPILPYIIL
jgi:hypothetical protein